MWISYLYFCILCICITAVVVASRSSSHSHAARLRRNGESKENNCWMTLKAKKHFAIMQKLEEKYAEARTEFDEHQLREKFDEEMLGNLLDNQGAANREVQKAGNQKKLIPSGINLGGHSMMRMPDSLMFFHRLKLRNDTRFRVNFLSSNFSTMTMTTRVSLNDLHLVGNYERVQTKEDPSLLHYSPSYGEIEVLLRDVIYKMEGRYRLQKDKIYLELVLSELYVPYDGILMLYTSNKQQQSLQTKNIGGLTFSSLPTVTFKVKDFYPKLHTTDFLDRLKNDLDLWMKDFFNEFLSDYTSEATTKTFMQYDKERIMTLNKYVDKSLKFLKHRLKVLKADVVKLPSFVINAFNGIVLQLKHGSLSGLDTMYRRSMATNSVDRDVRKVDALVAFSSLKARYSYEVMLTTRAPPLFGSLILSGDELSAIMSISMVKKPLFVDLKFDFIQQLKPESLTVEGSVGRIISTFKHMLELHITAIMTNTMIDQVKQLSTLTKCVPTLVSYDNRKFLPKPPEGQINEKIDTPESLNNTSPLDQPDRLQNPSYYYCPHRQPGGPRGPNDPRRADDPRRANDPRGPKDPRRSDDPRRADDPRWAKDPRRPDDPRRSDDPRGPKDPRLSNDPRRSDDPRRQGDPRGPKDPRLPGDPRRSGDPRGPKDKRDTGDPRLSGDPRGPNDPRLDGDARRPSDPRRPNDTRLPEDPRRKDDPRGPKDPRLPSDPRRSDDPRRQGDPRGPKDPRLPGDPRRPGDPRGPDEKRDPGDPRRLDDPRGPDDPRRDDDPRRPGDPRWRDDPRSPGDPRRQDDPRGPKDPRWPSDPRLPGDSRGPKDPRLPGDPRQPGDPRGPNDPRLPGDPRLPNDPRGPGDPRGHDDPRRPGDPRRPSDPRGPDDPRGPHDSRRPDDPRAPHDPRGPGDPRGPHDARAPNDPWRAGDARRSGDPRAPQDPVFPGDSHVPNYPHLPCDPHDKNNAKCASIPASKPKTAMSKAASKTRKWTKGTQDLLSSELPEST